MAYIEREALMSKLDEKVKFYISDRTLQGNFAAGVLCDMRDETIAKFPSADVSPVRHGRWIKHEDGVFTCSECGNAESNESYFCRYCGAKMDLEDT